MKEINLLLGASGSGKTELGKKLCELGIEKLISHTTRAKRANEEDGVSYHFVTNEEFKDITLIEKTYYDGNPYGISVQEIQNKLLKHERVFAIVNLDGVKNIKKIYGDSVVRVFFIEVNPEILEKRMIQRGDSQQNIDKRLKEVEINQECFNHEYADIVINNDGSLEETFEKLKKYF